jgi:hypothetical protein
MEEKYKYKPTLAKISFDFFQDGNTLGTTEEYEKLEISVESQVGDISEGAFYVLKTDGWSVDGAFELDDLFERINKSIDALG